MTYGAGLSNQTSQHNKGKTEFEVLKENLRQVVRIDDMRIGRRADRGVFWCTDLSAKGRIRKM